MADAAAWVRSAAGTYDGAMVFAGASATVDSGWLAAKITIYGLLILPASWRAARVSGLQRSCAAGPAQMLARAPAGQSPAHQTPALVSCVNAYAAWLGKQPA
jgi:hypothetical protein